MGGAPPPGVLLDLKSWREGVWARTCGSPAALLPGESEGRAVDDLGLRSLSRVGLDLCPTLNVGFAWPVGSIGVVELVQL